METFWKRFRPRRLLIAITLTTDPARFAPNDAVELLFDRRSILADVQIVVRPVGEANETGNWRRVWDEFRNRLHHNK